MPPDQRPAAGTSTAPRPPVPGEAPGDLALVAAVLRKDRKATARFVSEHADAIYGYVRQRLAPHADRIDDLVQETFLAALANLEQFRGTASLRSWLLGIARHKVEDYYRDQLRRPTALEDATFAEPAADRPLADETIDRERMEARTRQILRQLPEAYGVVLLWRYWENRSVRDIATSSGRTEKAIERLLARARARFREMWEQT